VPGPHGWERCPCSREIFTRLYIKPELRGADPTYPPEYDAHPPWPLADVYVQGQFASGLKDFRYKAWRSLASYLDRRVLLYDVMEANRIAEIRFARDAAYTSTQELEDLDLLVLFYGVTTLANKFTDELAPHILFMRQLKGKPSWVYAGRELGLEDTEKKSDERIVTSNANIAGLPKTDLRR
jgi:hypothetical protein